MLQNIIVITIISAAFIHVVWRWMPLSIKQRSAIKLSKLAIRLKLPVIANWSNKKPLASNSCGSCSSCNNCGTITNQKRSVKQTINTRLKS